MVSQHEKRRIAQKMLDEIAELTGPIYGVRLIEQMQAGGMIQCFPRRDELEQVSKYSQRTVAAFEVLTRHYQTAEANVKRYEELLRRIATSNNWSPTEIQEAIGDLK